MALLMLVWLAMMLLGGGALALYGMRRRGAPGALAMLPGMPGGAYALMAAGGLWFALWKTRMRLAGLVLIRQRPGSAKGVCFITLEDETGIANLVVWAKVFEANRRAVLSASMMAVRGRIQREGDVVHLVAQRITDLSDDLATVGSRDGAFPLPHGRGDQIRNGSSGTDPREKTPRGFGSRDIYIPDLHIDTIKVKARNFH